MTDQKIANCFADFTFEKSTKPDNVHVAITVMERVRDKGRKLNMSYWNGGGAHHHTVETEELADQCGTACCFAGWLAISPEFKSLGGRMGDDGYPIFHTLETGVANRAAAIAAFLGISIALAELITYTYRDEIYLGDTWYVLNKAFYDGADHEQVTPEQVIERLVALL